MNRVVRSALLAISFGLALATLGCGSSRPPGIAVEPGDSYVELSDLIAESDGTEVKLKVHYRFPDGYPHPDAWFSCAFEVNGGTGGVVKITRQGRELDDEGDIVATSNAKFIRQKSGTFAAQMRQGKIKAGPFHDVSAKLVIEF